MRKKLSAVLSVVVCLLLVGFIKSSIPPYTPTDYDVLPDSDGIGRLPEVEAEALGFAVTKEISHEDIWGPRSLTTDHVFLVMEVRLTPHQQTLGAQVTLHTADGQTYRRISAYPFPDLSVAYVGTTMTTHYFFELPADKVEGSWVGLHGFRADGIQPMWPRLRFDVTDPIATDVYVMPDDVREPRR